MKHRLQWMSLVPLIALLLGLIVIRPVAGQQTSPPGPVWTYELTDGAAYGLGLSEDGDTLVAVIGFGFEPGAKIVSLDPATGVERWSVTTEEGSLADPIVVDGVVYAAMGSLVGEGAAIYALDAATGSELWSTDIENRELPATPVDAVTYSDGKLYVNRGDATLLKLDAATGAIEWEVNLQKPSRGAPFVSGNSVYVSTGFDGGRVFAFDIQSGDERWSIEEPTNPVTGPVLANSLLYVPFLSGEMVAFDPATGEERWRRYVGELDESMDIDPNPGLPLVVGDTMFVSSNGFAGAFTVALDALTGEERWATNTGDFSAGAPAMFDGALLVGSDTDDLLALNPATGAELWKLAVPNRMELDLNQASPPLTSNGLIFIRDKVGSVIALGIPD